MALKRVPHPTLGTFVFGRRRPVARCPRLSLKNYLTPSVLPTPPALVDYSTDALPALTQLYLNDQLGDCVIAGIGHLEGVFTGNASGGRPVVFASAQIIQAYSAIGGYVPGNPATDQGCDEQTALNYWQQKGFPGGNQHRIAEWIAVNGADESECKIATWLFENLLYGVELPDAWINPFPSANGFTWPVVGAPDPNNGHCVVSFGYDGIGSQIDTWGLRGTVTWQAIAAYTANSDGGELYTVLSPETIVRAKQRAPSGVDWAQLEADMAKMRN
jgi:hypothetical protein